MKLHIFNESVHSDSSYMLVTNEMKLLSVSNCKINVRLVVKILSTDLGAS